MNLELLKAKAMIKPSGPIYQAVVANNRVREDLEIKADERTFCGVNLYTLSGMPDDEWLMFESDDGARAFIEAVERWISLGIAPVKAVRMVRSIFERAKKLRAEGAP